MSKWKDWQKVMLREEAKKMGPVKNWKKISELVCMPAKNCRSMYHCIKKPVVPKLTLVIPSEPPKVPDFFKHNLTGVRD